MIAYSERRLYHKGEQLAQVQGWRRLWPETMLHATMARNFSIRLFWRSRGKAVNSIMDYRLP